MVSQSKRIDDRISRGMAAQLELRASLLQEGDAPLGWKVGFGAPAAMDKLGIKAPLVGFLTENARIASDSVLSIANYQQVVVEPEIAVYMGADLSAGADESTARAAIAGLGPALELADVIFVPDDVERILSGNIYQRGIVLGPMDAGRAGVKLDGLSAYLVQNDSEIARTEDMEANTGKITDIVCQVANCLAEFDLFLAEGEVVIAGSIVPPVFVNDPCSVEYTLSPFDTIGLRFI